MTEPATVPIPAAPVAKWEDFIDIFYAPSSVFARRERAGFGVPMFVVSLLIGLIMLASFNAMSPIFDAEFSRNASAAIAKGATPEQLEKGRAFGMVFVKIAAFIAPPAVMIVTAIVLWLVGRFVAGSRQTLAAAFMVAAYANVPRVVGMLAGSVQALLADPASLTSKHSIALSPARFLDPATASPVLLAIAGRFDLFTIWVTILLGIGLAVTGRIPRGRAFAAAAIVWLLGGLPELIGALRQ